MQGRAGPEGEQQQDEGDEEGWQGPVCLPWGVGLQREVQQDRAVDGRGEGGQELQGLPLAAFAEAGGGRGGQGVGVGGPDGRSPPGCVPYGRVSGGGMQRAGVERATRRVRAGQGPGFSWRSMSVLRRPTVFRTNRKIRVDPTART